MLAISEGTEPVQTDGNKRE